MLVSSSQSLIRGSMASSACRSRTLAMASLRRAYATTQDPYDCVVIGGGPGGYIAAIKAAQLGMKTACIESRDTLGGTCLNVGCIPSKSMLHNSAAYHEAKHEFAKRGIDADVKLNLPNMLKAKDKSVKQLTGGVEGLFKKNKVDFLRGHGSFVSPTELKVLPKEGNEYTVQAKNVIIASGSEVTPFPGIEIDEKQVVTSTGALDLEKVPEKMVVIGAGVIGLEMGSVWNRLGANVEVVEFLNAIGGAGIDAEVATSFQKILKKQGMKFRLGTKVLGMEKRDGKCYLQVEPAKGGDKSEIEADVILVCIGRRPVTAGLNLEGVGIETDNKGRIVVDSQFNTSVKGVKCIGDCTFGPMLAHKAEEEGVAAVEYIHTGHGHVNYDAIPAVVYTHPEVAWVGATEEALKEAGVKYNRGVFPYIANSRAKTVDDQEGFVKFLTEAETDKILGCHIIGPNAGEAIAEAVLAIEYNASSEDIARTCHAHPTMSEAIKEAALAAHDKPLNF